MKREYAFVLLQDGSFFYLLAGNILIGSVEPAWMIYPQWTYHPFRLPEAGRFPLTEDEKKTAVRVVEIGSALAETWDIRPHRYLDETSRCDAGGLE